MSESFIKIAEAVEMTGKSRRSIQRLVESLLKKQPDQVMKEKTDRGYIWKINKQAVQQAYGVTKAPASEMQTTPQPPAPDDLPTQPKQYIEVALQGYAGMMAMHQEVKQVYEERLKDKDRQIDRLIQDLEQAKREQLAVPAPEPEQSRKGMLGWLFGG